MAKKEYKKSDAKERAMKILEDGIKNLTSSDKWISYLKFQSVFHKYSFNNTVMIMAQKPEATKVAGFTTWKKVKRNVIKGESGILIKAPAPVKVKELDKFTGEEVEKNKVFFKPAYVFDISQTEGEELPSVTERLIGDTELYEKVKAVVPFPVVEKECNGPNGYYSLKEEYIAIEESLEQVHKLKTLVHEWSHAIVHGHMTDQKELVEKRAQMELEAESIAFVVCDHLGVDTSRYSFGYLAGWGDGEEAIAKIKTSGEVIAKTSKKIIAQIDAAIEDNKEGQVADKKVLAESVA